MSAPAHASPNPLPAKGLAVGGSSKGQGIGDQPSSVARNSLWTTSELAAYLGVPVATIYKRRQTNYGPPGYRIGKYVRFKSDDVTAWLATRREGD